VNALKYVKNKSKSIKIAIVGVGNCCSSLYQGFEFYKTHGGENIPGIMFSDIGGYRTSDIEVVAAFDVDKRKVGLPIGEAIFAKPNCARIFQETVPDGPTVEMGHVLDGVSDYMLEQPEELGFRISDSKTADVVKILRDSHADILINYLPVCSLKMQFRHLLRTAHKTR
jgi:myo-inositol-1-phosphate synthase